MLSALLRSRTIAAACVILITLTAASPPGLPQEIASAGPLGMRFGAPNLADSDVPCLETREALPQPLRASARCVPASVSPHVNQARPALCSLGPPGALIEQARMHAGRILNSENACSAWFREADPDVSAVFKSLEFALREGPRYVQAYKSDTGELLLRHPYSASTEEGAGRGAIVVINLNGPFFVRVTDIVQSQFSGWPSHLAGRRSLTVGTFAGATLPAQITTLLHELAHVVGRIPDDSDDSAFQSPGNTERVLLHCRSAIKASVRKAANER
jgi:hypothetical protein